MKLAFAIGVLSWLAIGCDSSEECHAETGVCSDGHGAAGQGAAANGGTGNVGVGGGGGEGASALAQAYCNCMLGDACHDQYHDTFGPDSDEPAALANCLETASALPEAGMDVDTGNFIECRIHHCELGDAEPAACDDAVGGVCAD